MSDSDGGGGRGVTLGGGGVSKDIDGRGVVAAVDKLWGGGGTKPRVSGKVGVASEDEGGFGSINGDLQLSGKSFLCKRCITLVCWLLANHRSISKSKNQKL